MKKLLFTTVSAIIVGLASNVAHAVHDEDRLACLREAPPVDTMAQMACWRRKEGPRMEKIQKETEELTKSLSENIRRDYKVFGA
jgi:hypothetical protein